MIIRDLKLWKKVFVGISFAVLAMVSLTLLNKSGFDDQLISNKWVEHTYDVIGQAGNIETLGVDMETGMRGFLLSGDPEFLEPYEKSSKVFYTRLSELRKTVEDNPEQVRRLDEVKASVEEWDEKVAKPSIQLRKTISESVSMQALAKEVGKGEGKEFFDKFRGQIKTFIGHEQVLISERERSRQEKISQNGVMTAKLKDDFKWIFHTHEVLKQLEALASYARDMETGMRGYLISGKNDFLEPYTEGWKSFEKQYGELTLKVSDNPDQVALLKDMRVLIGDWRQTVCKPLINKRRDAGDDISKWQEIQVMQSEGKGKSFFDRFRSLVKHFKEEESILLNKRKQAKLSSEKILALNLQALKEMSQWVDHTHKVISDADHILESGINMETGMRGYLLTGSDSFLEPYQSGNKKFFNLVRELKKEVSDNSIQVILLEDIETTINMWITKVVEPRLALRRKILDATTMEDLAEYVSKGQGKKLFDKFRAQINKVVDEEVLLMEGRQQSMLTSIDYLDKISLYGTLFAILITAIIFFFLTKGITAPLKLLQEMAQSIGSGDLDVEIAVTNRDEIGALAASLAKMRDMLRERNKHIETQNWMNNGQNELSTIMRSEEDVMKLCRELLAYIASHIDAQVGALYLHEDERLRLLASYAYKQRSSEDLVFKFGEGLVGQSALEEKVIIFNGLSEDHLDLKVNSGLGESSPSSVVAVPLLTGAKVIGVLEVAVSHELSQEKIDFLEQIAESVAISISSAMTVIQTRKLLEETQLQSEKLVSQQEELRISNEELKESDEQMQAQQEELRVMNEELQEQTNKLLDSESLLQAQQEELRVSNEELEENSRTLKSQSDSFESKNKELNISQNELLDKQQELERSSRYKSEFLANMSHELRTPLNSILILSRLLMEKENEILTEKERSFGSTINQSGEDLLQLINDILDLSKVEAGHLDLNLEDVELAASCANMQRNFGALATQKGLAFDVIREKNCPLSFNCDSQRLEQILKNFLSNAFKFTDKGSVSLQIGLPSEGLQIEDQVFIPASNLISFKVIDSGKGIAADKMNMVFQAFRQEDGSISRRFGGTGLGLAISKKLASLLGGDIQVESTLGEGSCFNLLLPLTQSGVDLSIAQKSESLGALKTEKAAAVEPLVSGVQELSLLIIDADEKFNKQLSGRAELAGFNTMSVTNAQDASVLAEQMPPQAIIIDVNLPGSDGWEMIRKLRESCSQAKFWVISECGEVLDSAINGFYNKPLNEQEMNSALERIKKILSGAGIKLLIGGELLGEKLSSVTSSAGFEPHVVKNVDELRLELVKTYDGLVMDVDFDGHSSLELLQQLKREDMELPRLLICTSEKVGEQLEKDLGQFQGHVIMMNGNSEERLQDELQHLSNQSFDPAAKNYSEKSLKEKDLQGKKILVVDDDHRNIFSLSQVLESRGIEVEVAYNGVEALEQISKHDFDLVLMDVMMPEMDGLECTRQIRLNKRLKDLPILAVTAKAMKGDRDKCLAAGVNDYITKPVELPRLMELLKIWIK